MYKLFYLLSLLFVFTTNAQIHEIGGFAGGSNYIGDVGATTYISPNQPAAGILYKWNKNPRLSYRFSLTGAFISADDKDSDDPGRNQRGYTIWNSIKEVSAGLEFNFFDFNLHEDTTKVTPYVSSGLNYFLYHDSYISGGKFSLGDETGAIGIPMILGIKSNILPRFILGAEVGARYTFTDNLDGSNPTSGKYKKFGNINNNDWYVFSGFTLTYTFGKKSCYCSE